MNFFYETNGTNTYLVYEVGQTDSIDSMSLGMITNNSIPGVAQTIFTQMDSKKIIKYNVSSRVSGTQFFTGVVNKKRLIGFFYGIVQAMMSVEDYMIDPNSIILDLEYIFADVSSSETVLLCLPLVEQQQNQPDLKNFFKNIMFTAQFDQNENCDHVAKIINYLNSTPVFSWTDFKTLLENIDKNTANVKIQKTVVEPGKAVQPQVPVKQSIPPANQVQKPALQTQPSALKGVSPIPGDLKKRQSAAAKNVQSEEKEISFFYLMQHYNKDNAAAYKAQKEAKKQSAALNKGKVPSKPKKSKKSKSKKAEAASAADFGFTVPGQSFPSVSTGVQPSAAAGGTEKASAQPAFVPRQGALQPSMNFGETTVLGGGNIGETTVLKAGMQQTQTVTPHLIRSMNREKIALNKPVFRIGKERSYVDYFIGDNTSISRSHASVTVHDGEYYVMDTNSTNHTYVNGTMIQSNVEVKLSHGDTIRLANEDFTFELY